MGAWSRDFVILRDNFQIQPANRTIRSNMEVGPAKVRRRTVLGVEVISFNMMLTDEIKEQFLDFYYANDAGIFSFIRPDNGRTVWARFKDVPKISMNETLWLINVVLEMMP